jgi:putative nucleotidyltransferase with HDIG domain
MVNLQETTLNEMKCILDKKLSNDSFTIEHTQRVINISLSVGREIGLLPDELEDLYWGALLHDIGKIAINPEILNKPSALTLEEYSHVMTHVLISCNLAKNMVNEKVLEIIVHHHDYYNGSGFNQTIAGEDIPLGARILALADAFDAMTSDRPYRGAMPHEEAFMEVMRCSDTQFDPDVVGAFLKLPLFLTSTA